MNLLRLCWSLEKSRFTCARGRKWVDALGVLGFATATFMLLFLAAAMDLFIDRADVVGQAYLGTSQIVGSIPHTHLSEELFNAESIVHQFANASFTPSTFFNAYAIVSGIAYLIMLLPSLALGASCAAIATHSRASWLRTLRLVGLGRTAATAVIFTVAILHASVGIAAGGLMYFASLILWEMAQFQGTEVTATEVIISPQTWIATGTLIVLVTILSTALSVRRVSLDNHVAARVYHHPIVTVNAVVTVIAAVALTVYSESSSAGEDNTLAGSVAVGVIGLSVLFVGPFLMSSVGWLLQRTSFASLVVCGAYLQATPRAAFTATVPIGSTLAISVFLTANPETFLTAVALSNSDPITEELAGSATTTALLRLFQHDVTIGLLLTCVGAISVAVVANALRQAASILDHEGQDRALAIIGIPLPTLRRAYLWYQLIPLITTLLITTAVVVLFSSDEIVRGTIPIEAQLLYLGIVVFAVGIVVAANKSLAPLHQGFSEDVPALR